MEHVIEVVKNLFEDTSAYIGITTDILLIIVLGVLAALLVLLIVLKKMPKKKSKHEDRPGFIEVGPEPVIVYGRGKRQPSPPPATPTKFVEAEKNDEPLPQFSVIHQPEPEPEPLPEWSIGPLPGSQGSAFSPPPVQPPTEQAQSPGPGESDKPAFQFGENLISTYERKTEPSSIKPTSLPLTPPPPADDSPFKRFMAAEPREEVAVSFQPTLSQDSLPRMESDFAGEILLLFNKQGFTVEKVAYHGTYGADFIVSRQGMKTYVQVKDWKKKATPRTVQEARYYSNTNGCHKTILIPIAGFTRAANREASLRAVHLWDQKTIKRIQSGQLSLEEWIASSSF